MTNELAPVVLFVYNRLLHTQKTIEALSKDKLAIESELFVFSDGARNNDDEKDVADVRRYIKSIKGFRKLFITYSEKNLGLANAIISGVTSVINRYGKAIVLEDDLICSNDCLTYFNKALDFYEHYENIYSIAGYSPPIKISRDFEFDTYLIPTRAASWGWATWKEVWSKVDWEIRDYKIFNDYIYAQKKFDFMGKDMTRMLRAQMNGKIDSWSIRFDYHHFKNDAFCIYPVNSKILNIGMDASGTHAGITNYFNVRLSEENKIEFKFSTKQDKEIIEKSRKFYNASLSLKNKIKTKINLIKYNLAKRTVG